MDKGPSSHLRGMSLLGGRCPVLSHAALAYSNTLRASTASTSDTPFVFWPVLRTRAALKQCDITVYRPAWFPSSTPAVCLLHEFGVGLMGGLGLFVIRRGLWGS